MTIVIMGGGGGYGRWGKGPDLPAAKRQFRAQGGELSLGYEILTFGPDSEFQGVDNMGRYHWKGAAPASQEVPPRGKGRRR